MNMSSKKYLIDRYTLEPLEVITNSEYIGQPGVSKEVARENYWGEDLKQDVYVFTVSYSFTGSPILFSVRPSTWVMTANEISVDDRANKVSFSFKLFRKDPEEYKREEKSIYHQAFANVDNINKDVFSWNNRLAGVISVHFQNVKKNHNEENDLFTAINLKLNEDANSTFSVPVVRKKVVPQLTVSKDKEFSSERLLAIKIYEDILNEIYSSGKGMEKKPSLYIGKDEEGLKDQFLFILESRYDGATSTGETFNRGGKTDILLKYANDGTNLFVAECKLSHGASEFLAAISQLCDRYLSWRDSRAALLFFVKNTNFSSVIATIKPEIGKLQYYKEFKGSRGESSFSYIFNLPQDNSKNVFFEVLVFHYDK